MFEIAFCSLYLLMAFKVWQRVYSFLYRQHRRDFPMLKWNNGDRMFGLFWGGLVSIFWPVLLTVISFWYLFINYGQGIFKPLERLEKDGD